MYKKLNYLNFIYILIYYTKWINIKKNAKENLALWIKGYDHNKLYTN